MSSSPTRLRPVIPLPASGQNVPKPGGKFKQDKEKARPSDRLRPDDAPPTGDADPPEPDKKTVRDDKKLNKSKLRTEKTGDKLDAARDKLARQKPLKKPGIVKKAGRAAGAGVRRYVHGKIYQVEDENVGNELPRSRDCGVSAPNRRHCFSN